MIFSFLLWCKFWTNFLISWKLDLKSLYLSAKGPSCSYSWTWTGYFCLRFVLLGFPCAWHWCGLSGSYLSFSKFRLQQIHFSAKSIRSWKSHSPRGNDQVHTRKSLRETVAFDISGELRWVWSLSFVQFQGCLIIIVCWTWKSNQLYFLKINYTYASGFALAFL